MTKHFDPFRLFWPFGVHDVSQGINPGWFSPIFNFAGNAKIEERVISEVASYGKQIGWLDEIVLALATGKVPDKEVVDKLAKAIEKINTIKEMESSNLVDDANDVLDRLKKTDPASYERLIRRRAG